MTNPMNLDLRNTATFNLGRPILSPDQGAERLNILVHELGVEALSPRSHKEVEQLDELYSAPHLPPETVTIRRGPGQFYKIDCTITEQTASLRSQIRVLNQQLPLLSDIQTGIGILQALTDSSPKTRSYREQTQMQMNTIFGSDFVDSLQGSYRANISLLRTAALLHQNSDIFSTLIDLHQEANGLYEVQETFNRSCKLHILAHAKSSTESLNQLKNLIENEGYDALHPSEKFLKTCAEIVNKEANKTIALHRAIQESATLFIDKIEPCLSKLVCSAEDLAKASKPLAIAIFPIHEIRSKVQDKIAKAKIQIKAIQTQINSSEPTSVIGRIRQNGIAGAVNYMETLAERLYTEHAMWMQSHRQCFLIKRARNHESAIVDSMQQALLSDSEGITRELIPKIDKYIEATMPKLCINEVPMQLLLDDEKINSQP
ncbi:MAG: hypothetical protein QNJ27_01010 [Simkaniaceae bacterium]|nr:hypothetical protein [Simkaniaceae bacterium]